MDFFIENPSEILHSRELISCASNSKINQQIKLASQFNLFNS